MKMRTPTIERYPMWQQEFTWFFTLFHQELRKNDPIAFEVLMVLALATCSGFIIPNMSDFLDIRIKFLYELKGWSV